MNQAKKHFFIILFFLLPIYALNNCGDTLKGWSFFEIDHTFNKHLYGYFYFEHDNIEYRKTEEYWTRLMLGYRYNKWLKTAVGWDWFQNPDGHYYRYVLDNIGTIKEGNLTVSLRERYLLTHTPLNHTVNHLLRSRLKAQYAVPQTRLTPYLSVELFTWDNWKKTRYYAGTTVRCTDWMDFEAYYMYYVYNGKPASHIIGLGLNFNL